MDGRALEDVDHVEGVHGDWDDRRLLDQAEVVAGNASAPPRPVRFQTTESAPSFLLRATPCGLAEKPVPKCAATDALEEKRRGGELHAEFGMVLATVHVARGELDEAAHLLLDAVAAKRVLATSRQPEVSLSSRCTSRGRWPSFDVMLPSMPSMWRYVPEPPCTLRPIGLFSTITSSSSNSVIDLMKAR